MLDGSFWRLLVVALLLVAPTAAAAPPTPDRTSPSATDGLEILDLALDPTGEFVTFVVNLGTAGLNPGGIIGGGAPTASTKDIYTCDFGPERNPTSGSGCRTLTHQSGYRDTTGTTRQTVASTSYAASGGLANAYAVGGPSRTISLWNYNSDTPTWERLVEDDQLVTNITLSPDAKWVIAGTVPSLGATSGRVSVWESVDNAGRHRWDYNLTDARGEDVRPTAIEYSRANNVVVVGTTGGLVFLDPTGSAPTTSKPPYRLDTGGAVNDIVISSGGDFVAAGTGSRVYYVPLTDGEPGTATTWSRDLSENVGAVAMSLDGERFAAASGAKIHFYRHLSNAFIAEAVGEPFTAPAPVVDLAYDATGSVLVAIAGNKVYGFGPDKNTPIWQFDAVTDKINNNAVGLDGPLRKVAVSDSGQRIVVAGATKVMPFHNTFSARAAFGAGTATAVPGTSLPLSMLVENTGSLPDNYTFVVEAPPGWRNDAVANLQLDPDGSRHVNFSLEVPAGIPPGIYGATVKVVSKHRADSTKPVAEAKLNMEVPRSVSLQVSIPETSKKIILRQGGDETITVTVRNVGNAEGLVNMSAIQDAQPSWTIRFDPEQLRIGANSEEDVRVILAAPSTAASGARNLVTLRAKEGASQGDALLTAYVDALFKADLTAPNETLEFTPGESRNFPVTVRNTGNTQDTWNITHVITPASAANDWRVTLSLDPAQITLPVGGSKTLSFNIRPAVAEPRDGTLTIRAVSQGSPENVESSYVVTLLAKEAEEEEEGNLLPAPGVAALLGLVVLAAFVRRHRGGLR